MHDAAVLPGARARTRELLNATYFPEAGKMEELVVAPGLGDAAGVVGAILLAAEARPGYLQGRPIARLVGDIQAGLTPA